MILKASQRGGAKQLAAHLLRTDENEHVELHEVRGFLSDDLAEALKEAQAISKATRCRQFLFSVSFNPPEQTSASIDVFERAIDAVEQRNGLTGQPRIIIFHEKNGRRHAHAVWSRIDAETMTARNLPHFKRKLQDISRAIYIEQDWRMPAGLIERGASSPTNFTLAEWQQSRRMGFSASEVKAMMQQCWAASDSRTAFAQALAERGFILARGDRRGHVAVSCDGEVVSIARYLGNRASQVEAKLADPEDLPSVAEAKHTLAGDMRQMFQRFMREARAASLLRRQDLRAAIDEMTERHRTERERQKASQAERSATEARTRLSRLRAGLSGLWQRVSGARRRIIRENEALALAARARDRDERDRLIVAQLAERGVLEESVRTVRRDFVTTVLKLRDERKNAKAALQTEASASEPAEETRAERMERRYKAAQRSPRRSRRSSKTAFNEKSGARSIRATSNSPEIY